MDRIKRAAVIGLVGWLLSSQPALAAETLKIGFITTLSGPSGIIGKHMKDSVELALDHLGRKIGGLETEIVYGDDQQKPDVGKQLADEMLKKHKVQFVSGIIWSNVMLAVAPTVTKSNTFMIGTNAGPHELAGEEEVPQDLCRKLVDTANERGGVDNITVVVVKLPEPAGRSKPSSGAAD